jgi:hypothetical protein
VSLHGPNGGEPWCAKAFRLRDQLRVPVIGDPYLIDSGSTAGIPMVAAESPP